jgi:tetratricopeptide (TPR) repeat protein
MQEFR